MGNIGHEHFGLKLSSGGGVPIQKGMFDIVFQGPTKENLKTPF